jgi:hypothetical protein
MGSQKPKRVLKGYYTSCGLLKDLNVFVKTDVRLHTDPPSSLLVKIAYLCGATTIVMDREVADVTIVGACTVSWVYIICTL